jgi:hypothetical protein
VQRVVQLVIQQLSPGLNRRRSKIASHRSGDAAERGWTPARSPAERCSILERPLELLPLRSFCPAAGSDVLRVCGTAVFDGRLATIGQVWWSTVRMMLAFRAQRWRIHGWGLTAEAPCWSGWVHVDKKTRIRNRLSAPFGTGLPMPPQLSLVELAPS